MWLEEEEWPTSPEPPTCHSLVRALRLAYNAVITKHIVLIEFSLGRCIVHFVRMDRITRIRATGLFHIFWISKVVPPNRGFVGAPSACMQCEAHKSQLVAALEIAHWFKAEVAIFAGLARHDAPRRGATCGGICSSPEALGLGLVERAILCRGRDFCVVQQSELPKLCRWRLRTWSGMRACRRSPTSAHAATCFRLRFKSFRPVRMCA